MEAVGLLEEAVAEHFGTGLAEILNEIYNLTVRFVSNIVNITVRTIACIK